MTGVSEATTKDTKYTKTFSSVSSISWLIILRQNSVRLSLTYRSCLRAIDNLPDRLTSSPTVNRTMVWSRFLDRNSHGRRDGFGEPP